MDSNKLRDVLRKARLFIECSPLKRVENSSGCLDRDRICAEIDAALAEPPRQCDVGTADEQQARHYAWCRKYGIDGDNTVNCLHPDLSCDLCALRWAQMPYETEGNVNHYTKAAKEEGDGR